MTLTTRQSLDQAEFSPHSPMIIDQPVMSYDELILETRKCLDAGLNMGMIGDEPNLSNCLCNALEDSKQCIEQSFNQITSLLDSSQTSEILSYLDNTIETLQMLSKYLKEAIERISVSCALFKSFPVTTAHIILDVFEHCKGSEHLYGSHLCTFEKQLKDLFRSCHELQLIYLMIFEKHFIFDLSDEEQLQILIGALKLNLKIGEAVISLDLKTMAEQWKAYTVFCDKYANNLIDQNFVEEATDCLCSIVQNNMKNVFEDDVEEKVVTRSLKLTNFFMKILIKLCQIFRFHKTKDSQQIVFLLVTLKAQTEEYLVTLNKSKQLIEQVKSHVYNATEPLIAELLEDDYFACCVLNFEVKKYQDDELILGYILLLISIMNALIQRADSTLSSIWLGNRENNIVCSVFNIMPLAHKWFVYGLRFDCWISKSEPSLSYGLYDLLLTVTASLTATVNCHSFTVIEEILYSAIFTDDCWTAMFASDVWVILARYAPQELIFDQLIILLETYRTLNNNGSLQQKPQKTYISKTIERLFNTLDDEFRLKIFEKFDVNEENYCLWIALKLKNLPLDQEIETKNIVLDKLKSNLKKVLAPTKSYISKDLFELIATIKLTSTCHFELQDNNILKTDITKAWMKACLKNSDSPFLYENKEYSDLFWYYEYIESLCDLTAVLLKQNCLDNQYLVQIFEVIKWISKSAPVPVNLKILKTLENMSYNNILNDEFAPTLSLQISEIFSNLLAAKDYILKSRSFMTLKIFSLHTNQENIVTHILYENRKLKDEVLLSFKTGKYLENTLNWSEQLRMTSEITYTHKCLEFRLKTTKNVSNSDSIVNSNPNKSNSTSLEKGDFNLAFPMHQSLDKNSCDNKNKMDNFEITDMDNFDELFADNNMHSSKRIKLNHHAVDNALDRIEHEVLQLSEMKENLTKEQKKRVDLIYKQLENIAID